MVARPVPTHSDQPAARTSAPARLFTTWRVLLTRVGRGIALEVQAALNGLRRGASRTTNLVAQGSRRAMRDSREGLGLIGDSLAWLFNGWRRVVTRTAATLRPQERLASTRRTLTDAIMLIKQPASFGLLDASRADRLAALGFRSYLLGSAGAIAIGWTTAGSPGVAIASALTSALWAGARLAILVALAPRGNRARMITVAVWCASLLPYLIGATEGLRFVALAGSAFICLGALRGVGVQAPTARTMTAWAYGGQVGVSLLGWLLRGGLAVLASL
ncbi:MAG: hypothetical protein FD171_1835 [Actinobacteria bacterium]|nr:MAG: hypothetical protein FD171_1835 [Actinomycetota bacterium]